MDNITGQADRVVQDWNLYWNKTYDQVHGDKAIGNGGNGEWSLAEYRAAFPTRDARSVYGTPYFTDRVNKDSTLVKFTADIDDSSYAKARGKSGSDIGARAFAAPTFLANKSYESFEGDSGITYTDTIYVHNAGTGNMLLSGLSVVNTSGSGGLTAALSGTTVAAGAAVKLTLTAVGPTSTPQTWRVQVTTNDRKRLYPSWPVFWLGGASPGAPPGHGGGGGPSKIPDP